MTEFTITDATYDDIPGIRELVKKSLISEHYEDDIRSTGFVVNPEPEFYRYYIDNSYAYIRVIKNLNNKVIAYALSYSKELIEPKDPTHELNRIILEGMKKKYGNNENFLILKHCIICKEERGKGLAQKLQNKALLKAKMLNMSFVFSPIVNDINIKKIDKTLPTNMLINNIISSRAYSKIQQTKQFDIKKLLDNFIYSHEYEQFKKKKIVPDYGIHVWEIYGIKIDLNKEWITLI